MKPDRRPLYAETVPLLTWDKTLADLPMPIFLEEPVAALSRHRVYRYCSLAEAIALFTRKEWSFAHPSQWSDKYEREVTKTLFEGEAPFAYASPHVKCFSFDYSSNALWKTYAGQLGVVRLGIRLDSLATMLGNATCDRALKIYMVRTRYLDEKDLKREVLAQSQQTLAKNAERYAVPALTLKRSGFGYENEIRICALSTAVDAPVATHITLNNLDVDRFDSLLIDPYMNPWHAQELVALFKTQLGIKAAVDQSRFNKEVTFAANGQ